MPETKDPVAALAAAETPVRAAGARDLSVSGEPQHIDALIALAIGDRSPGVRLAAAGAAADILSRHRLPPRRERVSEAVRAGWLSAVAAVDPVVNAGLFSICGCLGTDAAFKRVLLGLRDPRQDVRAGACVGLWRLVASGAATTLPNVEATVVATLSDARIRVESRVEIARICADVGFRSAAEPAAALPSQCTRHTRTLAETLVARLEALPQPAGLWVRTGLDVGAVDTGCKGDDGLLVLGVGDTIEVTAATMRRGPLAEGWRLLSVKDPERETPQPVLQVGLDSWWPAGPEDLCRFGDRLIAQGHAALLLGCGEALGNTAASQRVRGAALLAAGQAAEAVLALEGAIAGKKVPADTWWFLAVALREAGRPGEARPHVERFLSKAGKKAPFVAEAKAWLAGG
jgi:hypothetical protein